MKNKRQNPFKNLKLDPYEQEINAAIEKGEYKEVKNMEEEKKRITKVFQAAVKKDRRVNIRVNSDDLDMIRVKAAKNRLPYQTLISTVLHHFAEGNIKIEL